MAVGIDVSCRRAQGRYRKRVRLVAVGCFSRRVPPIHCRSVMACRLVVLHSMFYSWDLLCCETPRVWSTLPVAALLRLGLRRELRSVQSVLVSAAGQQQMPRVSESRIWNLGVCHA